MMLLRKKPFFHSRIRLGFLILITFWQANKPVNPKRKRHHEPQSTHIHPFYAHPCRDYRPAVTVSLGAGMKLKTIQAFALIALAIVILIGAVTGDFDTAELLMYTAIFVGLTAVHITTEDNI